MYQRGQPEKSVLGLEAPSMVGRDALGGSPMVRPRQVSVMAMGGLADVGLSRSPDASSPASGRSAVSCSGLIGGGLGLVAGDLCLAPDGELYPGGGALTDFGAGSTGTGLPGLGGITLAPDWGSSTGGTGWSGSRMRDGGLLYGSPLLVLPECWPGVSAAL